MVQLPFDVHQTGVATLYYLLLKTGSKNCLL